MPAGMQSRHNRRLALGLVLLGGAVVAVAMLSLAVGARAVPLADVWAALTAFDPEVTAHRIVIELRLPRTLLGLVVGTALGLSGAIMQGATRNPLADPGIMGVHAGAAAFVVIGISVFGIAAIGGYVWLAFAGAGAATVLVYAVAALGRDGATPVKLALAGAAITAVLTSITSAILLTNVDTLDQFRFWQVGSLAGRQLDVLYGVLPFLIVGIVLALGLGRILDGLALGEDVARGQGQSVALSRLLTGLAWVILSGAATAACGPIVFVGLTVPHIARAITGPGYRWILPYSALLAPLLLLGADIVGRVIVSPGELQVGIVIAMIGGPFFILLVRNRRLAEL
jgi:iron complex transport system permease protein